MLEKLFAIRMVAKSFLGLSKSLRIICCLPSTLPSFTSKSVVVRPKKATSVPERIAEQVKKKSIPTRLARWGNPKRPIWPAGSKKINKLGGSGSNSIDLVQLSSKPLKRKVVRLAFRNRFVGLCLCFLGVFPGFFLCRGISFWG